nr:hypothetical protein [Tanacetum cinerariifolium]
NDESDLIESMLNRDSSIIPSYLKIDSLLDEFTGELNLLKSIPPGIDETNCYPEDEICFTERLLYDNSSPHPPEEFVSENSNTEIESFFPSLIPNEDSDSFIEETNLSFNLDDLVPPGIEEDNDSERDMLIHEELLTIIPFHSLLLHLADLQPMLKSSYKAEDGVIISIPPLVGGVADVVVEIKGTGLYYDYYDK